MPTSDLGSTGTGDVRSWLGCYSSGTCIWGNHETNIHYYTCDCLEPCTTNKHWEDITALVNLPATYNSVSNIIYVGNTKYTI